ncbi:MAG: hypothetical protein IT285_01175 [Bdellovibrionales bacterium]|nr:hypothetical protein [Bdellovibrionales bacterium]
MATMITTFLLFFMFVVNVGMLVNAKINLQNAADLAAYAGASTQARLLNNISFLNYEMRRQYKKFLFRYHIVGNMAARPGSSPNLEANPACQQQVLGGPERIWTPTGCLQDNYGVPTICVIFNSSDNFCQVAQSAALALPTATTGILDGITLALKDSIQQLELIRQSRCAHVGRMNGLIATLWLFNADPDLTNLLQAVTSLGNPAETRDYQNIIPIVKGLGLIPRMSILSHRIDTLVDYVNFPPQADATAESVNALISEKDPGGVERIALAYFTAQKTLGPTFSPGEGEEGMTLTEILPVGGTADANLLKLNRVGGEFEVYYIEPRLAGGGSTDCINTPIRVNIKSLVLAVSKDPTVLTYYAVRLKASTRVLFSPFGRVTLKAYAAAQPFGSRIGPPMTTVNFRKDGAAPSGNLAAILTCGPSECTGTPNLAIQAGDSSSNGWWTNSTWEEYFRVLRPVPGPGQPPLGTRDFERAYTAAMLPSPAEKGKYNIPHDLGATSSDKFNKESGNPFLRFFSETDGSANSHTYSFWAPIVSPDKGGNAAGGLQRTLNEMLEETFPTIPPSDLQVISDSIAAYANRINTSSGEDGETFNVARIINPNVVKDLSTGNFENSSAGLPDNLVMRNREDFITSWNDADDQNIIDRGRIGYSVKLVSFKTLRDKTNPADGATAYTNDLPTGFDADSDRDLQAIEH